MVDVFYGVGCACAVVSGIVLSVQAGMNASLGAVTGRSFASVVTFGVGLLALIGFFVLDVCVIKWSAPPTRQAVASTAWWMWIGGLMGAFYIATVIIFARRLGPGTLQALFVTALLLTAVTLDSTGWLNFKKRPLHWGRILGICLMLIGVALVTYFDGIRNAKDEPLPFIAAEAGKAAPIAASSPSNSSNSVPADKAN